MAADSPNMKKETYPGTGTGSTGNSKRNVVEETRAKACHN